MKMETKRTAGIINDRGKAEIDEGRHLLGGLVQQKGVTYFSGFGNTFESECIKGALPIGRNNPKNVPYNLYTEQISGTAFTAPRVENQRTWLYRVLPSVVVGPAEVHLNKDGQAMYFGGCPSTDCEYQVNPVRWKAMPQSVFPIFGCKPVSCRFTESMQLLCSSGGDSSAVNIYMYMCNEADVHNFYNSDGDFLLVPQQGGALLVNTELGFLRVEPQEICVIPRGLVFHIDFEEAGWQRGYILEVKGSHFKLPELGPIGANGLANARDFLYPTARCLPRHDAEHLIMCKMAGQLYIKKQQHSPFNVVAWQGNYLPFKYDLRNFCAVNSVTYDHMDPSIYTVLTCPTNHPGTALADFVIFPPRIMATDSNTLRPPWFHRNCMAEFMGLIVGKYDAKQGFVPGGASLHNCLVPHGPDQKSYEKAISDPCTAPTFLDGGLAFMFETSLCLKVAPKSLEWQDKEYAQTCWLGLPDRFSGWDLVEAAEQSKRTTNEKTA